MTWKGVTKKAFDIGHAKPWLLDVACSLPEIYPRVGQESPGPLVFTLHSLCFAARFSPTHANG